jgi:hypothetical protein
MQPFRPGSLAITTEKSGRRQYTKTSHPTRFGKYAEIKTRDFEFQFNLNGQIKFIRGLRPDWPHPFEALKRTDGNDWVYYTVGAVIEQHGIRDWLGEYYLPCFAYQSNAIVDFTPYAHPAVPGALAAWAQLYADIRSTSPDSFPGRARGFLDRVAANDDTALLGGVASAPAGKGAVYLSPFAGQPDGPALLETFFEIKKQSRLPVLIYLIQRL